MTRASSGSADAPTSTSHAATLRFEASDLDAVQIPVLWTNPSTPFLMIPWFEEVGPNAAQISVLWTTYPQNERPKSQLTKLPLLGTVPHLDRSAKYALVSSRLQPAEAHQCAITAK